ncbi:carboxymuconolactone decarboxylase family protein [Nonomuraea terrae]|uniref:carboxymuconolactone decarboxylase family protein n=1 Tax=Nonomuraea terrae TaxID=2530383 RepID=UPI0037A2987D
MHARMNHPAAVLPGAMQALHALGRSVAGAGLPKALLDLVYLRASQINGCSVCLDMHARDLKKSGESDERIWAVAGWRDAPYYSDAERAALALTEAVTRLSDRPEAVSDEVWNEAADHFDETELAALLTAIATINVWNRLNAATRQVAGAWNG